MHRTAVVGYMQYQRCCCIGRTSIYILLMNKINVPQDKKNISKLLCLNHDIDLSEQGIEIIVTSKHQHLQVIS